MRECVINSIRNEFTLVSPILGLLHTHICTADNFRELVPNCIKKDSSGALRNVFSF